MAASDEQQFRMDFLMSSERPLRLTGRQPFRPYRYADQSKGTERNP